MTRRPTFLVPVLAFLALTACDNQEPQSTMPEPESEPSGIDDLYLSTATQSNARASQLPTEPSEDVSSLLGEISLPTQRRAESDDYLFHSHSERVSLRRCVTRATRSTQESTAWMYSSRVMR